MFEFTCRGNDGYNYLTIKTDDSEKFDKVMKVVESFDDSTIKQRFNIDMYQGKYAMRCRFPSEVDVFLSYLREHGRTWASGVEYNSLLDTDINYVLYVLNGAFAFNDGTVISGESIERDNYKVLNFCDYNW